MPFWLSNFITSRSCLTLSSSINSLGKSSTDFMLIIFASFGKPSDAWLPKISIAWRLNSSAGILFFLSSSFIIIVEPTISSFKNWLIRRFINWRLLTLTVNISCLAPKFITLAWLSSIISASAAAPSTPNKSAFNCQNSRSRPRCGRS